MFNLHARKMYFYHDAILYYKRYPYTFFDPSCYIVKQHQVAHHEWYTDIFRFYYIYIVTLKFNSIKKATC